MIEKMLNIRRINMRHLMSPLDFSVDELGRLLDLANDIEKYPNKYAHACEGKKLATCFYEPSTRTRLSFEAAMLNLGGSVLGFASADSSSAAKGESVSDTIRVISSYADICAMRHPKEGAPLVASQKSRIPVINAGDGGHQHPTQTLADLLTIRSLKGRLDNMTIGLCGDLKFGRTVHSLISALIRYPGIKFVLISPEELRIPSYIREDVLRANNVPFTEVERLEDAIPQLDVLYMTRVQKERFFNEEDYVRLKDFYILTKAKMDLAPEDMIVLHPLPRVNEISVEVDDDPRAVYFKQAQYAVYVRMALILTLLEIKVE
jgi:aspartate carbamoyltransferase catalytic subunit